MLTKRISQIAVLIVAVTVALVTGSFKSARSSAAVDPSLVDAANYKFRLGEIAQINPRFDAQYEFRLGEISQMAAPVDARYEFRLGEIAQQVAPVDGQYLFRLGEISQMAPSVDPQYEFRKGERFGK